MRAARLGAVAVVSAAALTLLVVEAVSWPQSARFGSLSATTLACGTRLEVPSDAERAAGFRSQDVSMLPRMSLAARTAEVYHYTPTQAGRAGEAIAVVVQRGGGIITIPYVLRHADPWQVFAAQIAFKAALIALALLMLWRGHDRASLVLGLWCVGVGLGLPDAWWGALPVAGRIAGGALTAILWSSSPFLLYLVVESIAHGVSRFAKIATRCAMGLLMLPALLLNTVDATAQALTGCWLLPLSAWLANAAFAASQIVIVGFFALSYVRTSGLVKQRLRWVFWAFLLSRIGVLLNLFNRLAIHPLHLTGVEWASVLIFPIGCAYAILRHRIIDVSFVLNRTLVYTILTSAVVGVFVLLEDLLRAFAAGRGIGVAVEVTVALTLGFSFNALHRHVEAAIERALFRAKHEAAGALRRLAEEAPFTESADALLRRAVFEIPVYSGSAGAAIYERCDDGYRLSAAHRAGDVPELVDVDDLAFVRLRKSRTSSDLAEMASVLGTDGLLFAFTSRGQLTGALLCRRRANGEAFAPDEVALLSSVAHEVGAELLAIRARKQGEMLEALLSGSLELSDARARAGVPA